MGSIDSFYSPPSPPGLYFTRNGPLVVENDDREPARTPTLTETVSRFVLGQMTVRFSDSRLYGRAS